MVTNHSQKSRARELATEAGITYTEALARLQKPSINEPRYSARSLEAIEHAADALRQGFDVIVYGGTGTGKTTAMSSVLTSLAERQRRLVFLKELEAWPNAQEAPFERLVVPRFHEPEHQRRTKSQYLDDGDVLMQEFFNGLKKDTNEIFGLDELRERERNDLFFSLREHSLIVSTHARTAAQALDKVRQCAFEPGRNKDWVHSLYLRCERRGSEFVVTLFESIDSEKQEVKSEDTYLVELKLMAETLLRTLPLEDEVTISGALELAAERHFTTSGMMKYALSYLHSRRLIEIDYDTATVRRN